MNDEKGAWRKSSYSEPNGGNCVEVAYSAEAVGVRDSKNPESGRLTITPDQWARVVAWVR
jgi:Domain of unknown function (DUF397)